MWCHDYLKIIAALVAGRPPSQVEDEWHFSQTGVVVSAHRARLYPDHGISDLPVEECIPNTLLRPRDPYFSFAQFGDAAFQKIRLVPIDENKPLEVDVEPTDSKVTPLPADATDHESGEDVEVIDSDLEEGDNIFEYLNDYCFWSSNTSKCWCLYVTCVEIVLFHQNMQLAL